MLNIILVTLIVFLATLFYTNWQKTQSLKSFSRWTRGKIKDIEVKENGVFFNISWNDPISKEEKIYDHLYSSKKNLSDKELNILITKFVGKPFFLFLKEENSQIVEVSPYSNAKIMVWLYLLLTISLIFLMYFKG